MHLCLLIVGALGCACALPQAFQVQPIRNNTKPRGDTEETFETEDVQHGYNNQDTQQSVLNLDLNEQQRQTLNSFNQRNEQQRQNVNSHNVQQAQYLDNFYNQQQRQNFNQHNAQNTQDYDNYYNEQQRQHYGRNIGQSVNGADSFYNEQQRQHFGKNISQSVNSGDSFYNEQQRQQYGQHFGQNIGQQANTNSYYNERNRHNNSFDINQNIRNQNRLYPNLNFNGSGFEIHDQHGANKRNNSIPLDFERGVCYTEVPTASLVKLRGGPIPAGNGSRPELSKIRVCCTGYIRNIHNFRLCDPVCTIPCINSLCTAPDTCSCYPDHVKNSAGECVATCPIGCYKGHCSGGECMCNDGYKLDPEGKFCIPVCKNQCGGFGNCTGPNICECRKGYESVEGSCKPHCDNCANGDCVEPGKCKCHRGYSLNGKGECISLCTPGCGDHGFCTGPNTCTCSSGYQQQGGVCRPICTKPCVNGECVAPDSCKCSEGYRNEHGECVPECVPECGPQGRCVQPNVCNCNQGYEVDQTTKQCRPVCSKPCYNGECIGDNKCKCNNGFKESEFGECIPDCPGGCGPQGQCVSPNTCVCPPGFHIDPDTKQCKGEPGSQVKSSCAQHSDCLNGRCLNGECVCSYGYKNDETQPNKCIPHCPGGCPNGTCSSPNFCICNMGYVKDRTVKGSQNCVKRIRRSAPGLLEKLLVFEVDESA